MGKYPDVPFLLQNGDYIKSHESERCGTACLPHVVTNGTIAYAEKYKYLTTKCTTRIPDHCIGQKTCWCQHVNEQPYAPTYWIDHLLINPTNTSTAHPIHLHGGWSWVM